MTSNEDKTEIKKVKKECKQELKKHQQTIKDFEQEVANLQRKLDIEQQKKLSVEIQTGKHLILCVYLKFILF